MARALTTSEANQHLIELGYSPNVLNWIEDNEFTEPFGKTSYYVLETSNMFDTDKKYRWWDNVGTRFGFIIGENEITGKSTLYIEIIIGKLQTYKDDFGIEHQYVYSSGKPLVNYAKLPAKDKKKFIAILDNLISKKQTYTLPQTNWGGEIFVYGNALPEKIVSKS